MKKLIYFVASLFLIFASCEKVDFELPDYDDPSDGSDLITIKVGGVDGGEYNHYTSPAGETVFIVETNKNFLFTYETEINVSSQVWEFYNGETSFDEVAIFFYGGYEIEYLTLTVVDQEGVSYSTTIYLDLYPRGQNSPFVITDVEESTDGKWTITAGAYKNAWYGVHGSYNLFGSVTDEPWNDYIEILDTNYRMTQAGELLPSNYIGHWIKVQMDIWPGDHTFGVVRFDNEDAVWGNFKGSQYVLEESPTLLQFHLTNEGDIVPVIPLPGDFGDQGPTSVIRMTENEETVTVYFRLDGNFIHGSSWWSFLDENEEFTSEMPLYHVNDFPEWGAIEINKNFFPKRIIFGRNSGIISSNISMSQFYDHYFGYLFLHFVGT